jgi:hypothetical protein
MPVRSSTSIDSKNSPLTTSRRRRRKPRSEVHHRPPLVPQRRRRRRDELCSSRASHGAARDAGNRTPATRYDLAQVADRQVHRGHALNGA